MSFEINHILEKILILFYKYGIKSVSMDDIASELGISKKTLYHYFKDKNELIEQIEQYRHDINQKQYENIYNRNYNSIKELIILHGILKTFILSYSKTFEHDLKKYYPDLYISRYHERKENIIKAIKNNFQKGINEGVYRQNINIDILANHIISFILFITENEIGEEDNINKQDHFNEVFILHLYGILNEKGIQVFETKITKTNKEYR